VVQNLPEPRRRSTSGRNLAGDSSETLATVSISLDSSRSLDLDPTLPIVPLNRIGISRSRPLRSRLIQRTRSVIHPNRYEPIGNSQVSLPGSNEFRIRRLKPDLIQILQKSYLEFCRSKNSKQGTVGILETSRIQWYHKILYFMGPI
jgi:hypothetical protein